MRHGLLRDGFEPESQGGRAHFKLDGSPMLHYPLTDHVKAASAEMKRSSDPQAFESGAP